MLESYNNKQIFVHYFINDTDLQSMRNWTLIVANNYKSEKWLKSVRFWVVWVPSPGATADHRSRFFVTEAERFKVSVYVYISY